MRAKVKFKSSCTVLFLIFLYPIETRKKKEEKEEDDGEMGIIAIHSKIVKITDMLLHCLGDVNNIKGHLGWFFIRTQSH